MSGVRAGCYKNLVGERIRDREEGSSKLGGEASARCVYWGKKMLKRANKLVWGPLSGGRKGGGEGFGDEPTKMGGHTRPKFHT